MERDTVGLVDIQGLASFMMKGTILFGMNTIQSIFVGHSAGAQVIRALQEMLADKVAKKMNCHPFRFGFVKQDQTNSPEGFKSRPTNEHEREEKSQKN
ncbi:hypothetical protein J5N97_015639 [Dioscorea zingiberensis]|uniref:Uncharacterized protein n=1 Tax=Dioscorea zingiberensis TaxID=325984 RepID=A0A9D5CIR0_9LILI|nr:hypothetical protein J5N97_015639 [Dioscorea zingiberensis]